VKGYSLVYWLAVFAPAADAQADPEEPVDAIAKAMKDPRPAGDDPGPHGEGGARPRRFRDLRKDRTKWWTDAIKAAGIEPE
jgi:hypothetical protein